MAPSRWPLTSGLKQVLEAAATSEDLSREDRFSALDGLAFWDAKDGSWEKLPDRIHEMRQLVRQGGLGEREEVSLLMKEMVSAGRAQNLRAVAAAYASGELKARQQTPSVWRVFKYDHALALFHAGAYRKAAQLAQALAIEYYDLLEIGPEDALAKNPAEILSMLPDTPTREDDLKHLADCLHLYSRARRETGDETRLADIHAMKFYVMANAMKSAATVGQDVVDSFIGHGDAVGARIVLEQHVLPLVQQFGLTELLLQVRGQYAVVLAYCGEFDRARDEMRALEAYDATPEHSEELQNQRTLIAEIVAGDVRLPQRTLPPPSRPRIVLPRSAKVGRNEQCPCGSGVKYKRCHGR